MASAVPRKLLPAAFAVCAKVAKKNGALSGAVTPDERPRGALEPRITSLARNSPSNQVHRQRPLPMHCPTVPKLTSKTPLRRATLIFCANRPLPLPHMAAFSGELQFTKWRASAPTARQALKHKEHQALLLFALLVSSYFHFLGRPRRMTEQTMLTVKPSFHLIV